MVCRSCPANPLHPGILLELLPNVRSSCFLMRSSYHRPICISTDNMCIFYTFVPFYKFKMQYLYSFTKPFSIIGYAKVPILYYLCYFSHYVVYQMCFRNTYCVTDDIRYATIGQDCGSRSTEQSAGIKTKGPGTLKRRSFLCSGVFSYQFLLYFRL